MSDTTNHFPPTRRASPRPSRPRSIELADGDELDLRIAPVAKRIGDATVRMLAYNGSIPGPTLQVQQGSEIVVHVDERGRHRGHRALARAAAGEPLRRHARDAGADPGRRDASRYRVAFPDPGVYWYHPHIREDYGQEMGLYGNIARRSRRPGLLAARQPRAAAHPRRRPARGRQDRAVQPHRDDATSAMGRFGNVLLVGGETGPRARRAARRGRALLLDQHRQHAGLQRRAARARG